MPNIRAWRAWTLIGATTLIGTAASAQSRRPMTFLDVQNMRQVATPDLSTDGRWLAYTISVPDWREARRQSDVYIVNTERGIASTRQLTYTKEKTETTPRWSHDGSYLVFASDRDATARENAPGGSVAPRAVAAPNLPAGGAFAAAGGGGSGNQLYVIRPDGGEARKITDARDGVSTFAFAKDGKWLVYRSGRAEEEQLYALSASAIASGDSLKPVQITHHPTGVGLWQLAPDSRRIYFVTSDTVDKDERARFDKRFDVRVRNPETPISSLWMVDLDSKQTTRLTHDTSYSVGNFTISDDGKWIGFHGMSPNRYERNILEQNDNADLYLLEVGTGKIERLTNNKDIGEGPVSFSPDGRLVAFSAPDDFQFMHLNKIYVRELSNRGGQFRKIGGSFDGDVTIGWWSKDGRTIYFNEGIKATDQLCSIDVASGEVKQLTHEKAALRAAEDGESGRITITYSDPKTPTTLFTVASVGGIADRSKWVQLTDANPWVRNSIDLGEEEEVTWKSRDGRMVGGVLVKPVGYQPGKRYPLIVAIHGGPAAADVLGFNGGYGSQVYAGAGYAVLMPNYRESTNYGQRFKIESQGDYFTKGFDDIMTGVDYLIGQGIVDSTQMGALGWSAGGHYSDWILTHTNRFKAISTGAGTFNWISMYGESDTQRLRQWYLGDKLWYDDMEHWWRQSPAAYIKNAKTPTFIHVVDGDPRVPRPQSEELHMALKRLGVPTEFWVYPGNSHGIPDPRNQYLKSVGEMAWMDYWVRHSGRKFQWRDVLKSVEDAPNGRPTVSMTP
ncbi:MAG TPA: prolyl oligopeptidase family serine peptidase [Gemmatimonadaceae bacterium]